MTRKQRAKYNTFIGILLLIFFLACVIIFRARQLQEKLNPPLLNPCPSGTCEVLDNAIRYAKVEVKPVDSYKWDEVAKLIIEEFSELGKKTTFEALQIAYCESRWEEDAVNTKNKHGTWDGGAFQFNSIHKITPEKLFDVKENVRLAKQMFVRNGKSWNAWACKRVLK